VALAMQLLESSLHLQRSSLLILQPICVELYKCNSQYMTAVAIPVTHLITHENLPSNNVDANSTSVYNNLAQYWL
jgi:hypothetical protein